MSEVNQLTFEPYPKTQRLGSKNNTMVITEKIDGTNAQVVIQDGEILVGSRTRVITPGKNTDNYGFARYVEENREMFLGLGNGRHYGEWWGSGIQRGYNRTHGEKHFSLFNTSRPAESLPVGILQVPVLYTGQFDTFAIDYVMDKLWDTGSHLCPDAWFKPEGIIIYHTGMRQCFKKTFEDSDGKWRKAA